MRAWTTRSGAGARPDHQGPQFGPALQRGGVAQTSLDLGFVYPVRPFRQWLHDEGVAGH